MVQQLLAFSRRQVLTLELLDLNDTLRGVERTLRQCVGPKIRLALELAEGGLPARVDRTGLSQILLNLCANARDAMPEGGAVTIRTDRLIPDASFLATHPGARHRSYARLTVQDTGIGMDPSVATHIFEPFFTTKRPGRGTGLGLSVVYGLVKQHEGCIDVETAPDAGTTFHLHFPQEDRGAPTEPPHEPESGAPGLAGSPGGEPIRRRVLVVDDNPSIRALCNMVLERDYDVTGVESGAMALKVLETIPYHLVLTDLLMPEMDGFALMAEIVKRNLGVHVVVMTALRAEDIQERLKAGCACDVIYKPFTPAMLLDAIRRPLRRRSTA